MFLPYDNAGCTIGGRTVRLLWKLHDSIKNPTKIDLHTVNLIQAQGKTGLTITSQKGDTLLDVEADSEEIRDTWVRRAG